MTPEKQKKIDALHGYVKRILEVSLSLLFAMGVTVLLPSLLNKFGWDITVYAWYAVIAMIYKYIAAGLGIVAIFAIASLLILSVWATDEEREQVKTDMKEIMQEIREEEKVERKHKKIEPNDVKCPLIDLTPAQIGVVQDIIKKIPVGRYIRALQVDGYLPKRKDLDLDTIIDWVNSFMSPAEVDAVHFRSEFYIRPKDNKITKMGNKVRQGFDKL